jgi:hypothetical protein
MMVQGLKRTGLWSFVIALVMAAQVAFAFHHLEHKFEAHVPGDECAICHVISTAAPPPEAETVAAPVETELTRAVAPASSFVHSVYLIGFQARAPPILVSI